MRTQVDPHHVAALGSALRALGHRLDERQRDTASRLDATGASLGGAEGPTVIRHCRELVDAAGEVSLSLRRYADGLHELSARYIELDTGLVEQPRTGSTGRPR